MNGKRLAARRDVTRRAFVSLAVAALAVASMAHATTCIWTGATDTNFENAANWSGGAAPRNDYTNDVAVFTNAPTANQPLLTLPSRYVAGVRFESAGWKLGGGTNVLAFSKELGLVTRHTTGTVTVACALLAGHKDTDAQSFNVRTGGTLRLDGTLGTFNQPTNATYYGPIVLSGGGTLEWNDTAASGVTLPLKISGVRVKVLAGYGGLGNPSTHGGSLTINSGVYDVNGNTLACNGVTLAAGGVLTNGAASNVSFRIYAGGAATWAGAIGGDLTLYIGAQSAGIVTTVGGTNNYAGFTRILSRATAVLAADSPAGAPGAFGNALDAVQLGDPSATGSGSPVCLLAYTGRTLGRDVLVGTEALPHVLGTFDTLGNVTNAPGTAVFGGTIFVGANVNADLILTAAPNRQVDITGAVLKVAGGTDTGTVFKVGGGLARLLNTNSCGAIYVLGGSLALGRDLQTLLGGTGCVASVLTVGAGGVLSPGSNAPARLLTGDQVWAGGGAYAWEINDALGASGDAQHGFDSLVSTGGLTIAATATNPFTIRVTGLTASNTAGAVANFDRTRGYTWPLATFAQPVSGFSTQAVALDASAFTSANLFAWNGSLQLGLSGDGRSVQLNYAIRRPALVIMLVGGPSHAATNTPPAGTDTNGVANGIIFDVAATNAAARLVPDSTQVTVRASQTAGTTGLVVTIAPGSDSYPGAQVKPPAGQTNWDLSAYGHVEARIVNTGTNSITVSMRVDNAGNWQNNPWNTESITLAAGATGTVKVIFGYAYGFNPDFALNPACVVNILFFLGKTSAAESFRIESLLAAGPPGEMPPISPANVRVTPTNGFLFASSLSFNTATQLAVSGGASATLQTNGLAIAFAAARPNQTVTLKPPIGRWDLRACLEVRAHVRNTGTNACTPRLQVTSNGGPTDLVPLAAPLAPGAETDLVVSFIPAVPWQGIPGATNTQWNGVAGTGTKFTSDAVSGVALGGDNAAALLLTDLRADVPVPPVSPAWLGTRPPVDGDWTLTFDEEFNGTNVDLSRWNIYTANYWDTQSHFSKDNVIVSNGLARLHYEKKTGYQNDSPSNAATAYAVGYLDTYGKWVQRYGYFEARLKLPHAPGLWPAFWMMPDRGKAAGSQGTRQSTYNGGMEFDIMEFLSRWGIYRYNIAMHWDGYGAGHQQTGNQYNYVAPDTNAFVTCGLLWTPGSATYYCNGAVVAHWDSPRISSVASDLMVDMVSGGWDNDALDDAQLPDDLVIDYVRCWQRADLASSVDGVQSTQPTPYAP